MKKYKKSRGITLISLIITIVILIILAAITVSTIREDALLEKVESAKDTAASSINDDKINLGGYENYINQNIPNGTDDKSLISFVIVYRDTTGRVTGRNTYYAEEGMDWYKWVESSYCPDYHYLGTYYLNGGDLLMQDGTYGASINATDKLKDSEEYDLTFFDVHHFVPPGTNYIY